ncbi:MAG: SRPBCC family protein [bacterium]
MQQVEVQQQFRAPIERVFARYNDHVSWGTWSGLGAVRLARQGVPAPNGVGCVREFKTGGAKVREEVVSYEPPHRMTYRLIAGPVPMADHLGEAVFEARDDGTLVTWRCRFRSRIPGGGWLMRIMITRLFSRALRGLARDLGA